MGNHFAMSQITLHRYGFPIRTTTSRRPNSALPTQGFPLMRLPYSIRRRIYILAGLFSGFKIHLNYEPPEDEEFEEPFCTQFLSCANLEDLPQQDEVTPWSEQLSHFIDGPLPHPKIMLDRDIWWPSTYPPVPPIDHHKYPALPFQLLYVSRQMSIDVKKIFWSENYFTVAQPDIGGLSFIHSLSPIALRSLTSLSVRLNYWGSKWNWHDGLRDSYRDKPPCHVCCPSYGFQDPIRVPRTREEKKLMEEWNKVCNHLAKTIRPGVLKLWIFCDVLNQEAAEMILKPLSQLPTLRECGIRLSYAPYQGTLEDLATETALRLTSVPLSSSKPAFRFLDLPFELQTKILAYTSLISTRHLIWFPKKLPSWPKIAQWDHLEWVHHRKGFDCCLNCRSKEEICYCSSKHSAYSTTCTCWTFPKNLFLVSRQFRSLIISIFFSRNKFLIAEKDMVYGDSKSGLHDFLLGIPVEARRHLRYVEWLSSPSKSKKDQWDWIRLVDFCADQFDISKFKLIINMSLKDVIYHDRYYTPLQDPYLEEEIESEWDTALRMAKTMAKHRGWKDVYFHLSHQGSRLFPGNRKRMEGVLEKLVIGRDYDSLSRGKVYRECSCRVYYEDARSRNIYAYWEEVYRDDPNWLPVYPPIYGNPDAEGVAELIKIYGRVS